MKKTNSAIYIPNMDAKEFDKICAEKELQFIYTQVPPHGRLIDADELANSITGAIYHSDLREAPTIIPAEEGEA